MPKLSNVTLKAMALTGNPANRRPIHAKKSAEPMETQVEKADWDESAHPRDDNGRFGSGGGGGGGGGNGGGGVGKTSSGHEIPLNADHKNTSSMSMRDHKDAAAFHQNAFDRYKNKAEKLKYGDPERGKASAMAEAHSRSFLFHDNIVGDRSTTKSAFERRPIGMENSTMGQMKEISPAVVDALQSIVLTKAAGDAEHEAAAEAVGRLLAAHPSLTHEDLLAVAKAAGVAPVAKADGQNEEEEEDEELEDETDEDSATDKKGKFKKGNPWAEKMKKSATEEAGSKLDEVLKSAGTVEVQKAVEAMRKSYEERIAKAERVISEEREHRLTNLIKSEVQGAFQHLSVDHDKLTSVLKHARESGNPNHAKDLMQVLKAAEAQVALAAKSGGTAFQSVGKSSQFGAGTGGDAMSQINAHVDALVQKGASAKSRAQLVDEFLMTDAGRTLWAQHVDERGF